VHTDAASVADIVLSNTPKFVPAIVTNIAPKTGPLVVEIDDAVGASYSNAAVLEPNNKPIDTAMKPERLRPEGPLLKVADDDNQLEASCADRLKVENTVESEVQNPAPRIEITTAPLVGRLLQLAQLETNLTVDGEAYECSNDEELLIDPTDSVIPNAEPLPEDAFPITDEEDTHKDCSTAVPLNETRLVASCCESVVPATVM